MHIHCVARSSHIVGNPALAVGASDADKEPAIGGDADHGTDNNMITEVADTPYTCRNQGMGTWRELAIADNAHARTEEDDAAKEPQYLLQRVKGLLILLLSLLLHL